MLAGCSMNQLPGCECTGNRSCAPLGCQNGAYMGIYGHMQPYIQAFGRIYNLKTYIFILLHLWPYLFVFYCSYIRRYVHIKVFFSCIGPILHHCSPQQGESPMTPRELCKTAKYKQNIGYTIQHFTSVLYLEVQDNRGCRRECK